MSETPDLIARLREEAAKQEEHLDFLSRVLVDDIERWSLPSAGPVHHPVDEWAKIDGCALAHEARKPNLWREAAAELDRLTTALDTATAQLPDGMKHCTVVFKECEYGHGWLTATNWVQHGCPTCALATAERERDIAHENVCAARQELGATEARIWREAAEAIERIRTGVNDEGLRLLANAFTQRAIQAETER